MRMSNEEVAKRIREGKTPRGERVAILDLASPECEAHWDPVPGVIAWCEERGLVSPGWWHIPTMEGARCFFLLQRDMV